jgi:hypothetical protein
MGLTAVALVAGGLLGVVAGGRSASVSATSLHWWGALATGVALQLVAGPLGIRGLPGTAAIAGSYLLLLSFAVANRALGCMPVVLVGLSLNAVVILVNSGMPVRAEAVAAVGLDPRDLDAGDLGAKRHLEGPDDRLTGLGDVVPLRPLGEVVSVGDLLLAVGVGGLLFRLLHPRSPAPLPS